jgi:hypothetical protein
VNPFGGNSNEEVLAEREDDKKKFLAMSLFWLKAEEVTEILRRESEELHGVFRSNIADVDLDYEAEKVIAPTVQQPNKKLPVKVRIKLGLSSPSAWL